MPYKPFTINALGGLNEDENPAALQQDQLRVATNCARLGTLTGTRPGLVRDTEYDDTISGTPSILGMHEFRKGRDGERSIVTVADDGAIYYSDTDTLTVSSVTITSGATADQWSMAIYQNLLWGC